MKYRYRRFRNKSIDITEEIFGRQREVPPHQAPAMHDNEAVYAKKNAESIGKTPPPAPT